MIINMRERASDAEIQHVIDRVKEAGYQAHVTRGEERTIVAAVGEMPSATDPSVWPCLSTSSSALRNSACAARARARNARPGWVSTTPVGVRWRSRACNSASSPRTLRVIAGCDTPSFRAAARMPPDSTTATKSRI